MKKSNFFITVPQIFSPITAISAESKPYIITLRFNVDVTLQINASNSLILKKIVLIKAVKNHNIFVIP